MRQKDKKQPIDLETAAKVDNTTTSACVCQTEISKPGIVRRSSNLKISNKYNELMNDNDDDDEELLVSRPGSSNKGPRADAHQWMDLRSRDPPVQRMDNPHAGVLFGGSVKRVRPSCVWPPRCDVWCFNMRKKGGCRGEEVDDEATKTRGGPADQPERGHPARNIRERGADKSDGSESSKAVLVGRSEAHARNTHCLATTAASDRFWTSVEPAVSLFGN